MTFDSLNLQSGASYTLLVRAVNNIGLPSEIAQQSMTIETSKPEVTGKCWVDKEKR